MWAFSGIVMEMSYLPCCVLQPLKNYIHLFKITLTKLFFLFFPLADELDNMSSTERISFLQEKLQEIRKYYMSLKSEVATIDRRRKRLKKKDREGKVEICFMISEELICLDMCNSQQFK